MAKLGIASDSICTSSIGRSPSYGRHHPIVANRRSLTNGMVLSVGDEDITSFIHCDARWFCEPRLIICAVRGPGLRGAGKGGRHPVVADRRYHADDLIEFVRDKHVAI